MVGLLARRVLAAIVLSGGLVACAEAAPERSIATPAPAGSTTLAVMAAPESQQEPLAAEKRVGFAAAVALYPGCRATFGSWRPDGTGTYQGVAPLLILIGERDDWTPATPCVALARSSQA